MTRTITPSITDDDALIEATLRPRALDDYVGQEKAKGNLRIFIDAARGRDEALDHVLLYGPPGARCPRSQRRMPDWRSSD